MIPAAQSGRRKRVAGGGGRGATCWAPGRGWGHSLLRGARGRAPRSRAEPGVRGWLWGGGHGPGCDNRRRPDRRPPSQAWPGPPVFAGLLGTSLAACPLPPSGLPPCPGAVPSTWVAPAPPPATAPGLSSLPKRAGLRARPPLSSYCSVHPKSSPQGHRPGDRSPALPWGWSGTVLHWEGRMAPGWSWGPQEGLSLLLRCPPAGMDPGEWEQ